MRTLHTPTRWNLNTLLSGFDMEQWDQQLNTIGKTLRSFDTTKMPKEQDLHRLSDIIQYLDSAESFYYCLTVEEIAPTTLSSFHSTITSLTTEARTIRSNWQELLDTMSHPQREDWSYTISHRRLIAELTGGARSNGSLTALKSLEERYLDQVRNLTVHADLGEGETILPFSEANKISMTHADPAIRERAFQGLNRALQAKAPEAASIYNEMVGLRLEDHKQDRVDYLDDSLVANGISSATLHAMWDAVDAHLDAFSAYLSIKAKEAGKEKLSWLELMTTPEDDSPKVPFPQAIEGILTSFKTIDPRMTDFVKEALSNGWVDAEARPGKPSGGFCAPFLTQGESRISLSYDNSLDSARRLAHELGHAWHFKQMKPIPTLRSLDETLEMTTAESASILFETALIDEVIQGTHDPAIKKSILGWKVERSINYLMSIRAAYLFETAFYEKRKSGPIPEEEMEALLLVSQQKAYGNRLKEYEPCLWMKYPHFFRADLSFYNYPYSFGFLFSISLLELAREHDGFAHSFQSFLSETGMLPLEELTKKHFNIDLSHPALWEQTMRRVEEDVKEYSQCM
ncbi:M3 family metallopeptidase [Rossellomorea marisflavi]|uniref:M3 family metallopeptidase n=1 Tax=Rossellomorea marisflavi TaxID=189381 RepID=UPI00296ECE4E|nr:M3 family metallopeptidase [Rossellomorea marisflavi]MDW4525410.1 M3 family metallopeptidase [Rossellomorea marisflavi]